MKVCKISGCDSEAKKGPMCYKHRSRVARHGSPDIVKGRKWVSTEGVRVKCSVVDCEADVIANGFCNAHNQYIYKGVDPHNVPPVNDLCPVPQCGRIKRISSRICKRCNQFRWRYSLTVEQVVSLWEEENRYCANPGCRATEWLHLDHNHSCCPPDRFPQSHKISCGDCVRGWLCQPCNTSLGKLQENPRKIQGLLDYLKLSG